MAGILGFIPARGASKGIPNKNMRMLRGKPLVQWTIEAALQSKCTRVVVSSADPHIGKLAVLTGAEWLQRPVDIDELGEISQTEAHALRHYSPDYFIRLQPTSPLRTTADIDAGIAVMLQYNVAVLGVCETRYHPNLMFWTDTGERVVDGDGWKANRQLYRHAVWVNGAFYGAPIDYYCEHGFDGPDVRFLEMPEGRSIDIDTEQDLLLAGAQWDS